MENRTVEKTCLVSDIHRSKVKIVSALIFVINFLGILLLFQNPVNALVGSSAEDRRQYKWAFHVPFRRPRVQRPSTRNIDIIVASTKADDTSWLYGILADWPKSVYVVDDATVGLSVPQNKGREAMPYLTYASHPLL